MNDGQFIGLVLGWLGTGIGGAFLILSHEDYARGAITIPVYIWCALLGPFVWLMVLGMSLVWRKKR